MDRTLQLAGMHPIEVHTERRRQTVSKFINTRPILDLCKEGERRPGSPTRTKFWWEQPQLVDLATVGPVVVDGDGSEEGGDGAPQGGCVIS